MRADGGQDPVPYTDVSGDSLYPTGDVLLIRHGCLCCPSVACDSGAAVNLHCPLAKRVISGLAGPYISFTSREIGQLLWGKSGERSIGFLDVFEPRRGIELVEYDLAR